MRSNLNGALVTLVILSAATALAQGNGKLQIRHMDVGQADGAVLISPGGKVVLFDVGEDMKTKDCTKPLSYLDQLGVKQIDVLFVSHYHFDHIGCIPAVLEQFPLKGNAYDRGGTYPGQTYAAYVAAVGGHRKTASVGQTIALDDGSQQPVAIAVFALGGKSKHGQVQTTNENDLSLGVVVSFGGFREEIGGDLSGDNTEMYQDVETPVASDVGKIDVYKVHHHCSAHSSNPAWLAATTPTIGIISTGDGNGYGHPTADCLERLHTQGIKRTYWTERGNGGAPEAGLDVLAGNVSIEVAPGAGSYTVSSSAASTDTYQILNHAASQPDKQHPQPPVANGPKKYAWSSKSRVYHYASCEYVANISKENLQESDTPPAGKKLHGPKCPVGGQ